MLELLLGTWTSDFTSSYDISPPFTQKCGFWTVEIVNRGYLHGFELIPVTWEEAGATRVSWSHKQDAAFVLSVVSSPQP